MLRPEDKGRSIRLHGSTLVYGKGKNRLPHSKFRLNAAVTVCSQKGMLAHAPGMVFGGFLRAGFQNNAALSEKEIRFGFPINAFKYQINISTERRVCQRSADKML